MDHPQHNTHSSQPITLSLFSGAGGLDIGFHNANFNIAACVEIEEPCCATLALNRDRYSSATTQILNQDIRHFNPEMLQIEHVDFMIGGPPCQSFSAIGRRAGGVNGISDDRGSLFEHYCRLVQHYQPRGFLFENVRGILGSNKGKDWQRIVAAFADLGYELSYKVLDAADYGVPQHRERLILVGTKRGQFRFPRPTHGPSSPMQRPHVSAYEAIADLQAEHEPTHAYSGKYGHLLEAVPPGQNYHFFTQEMGYPNPIFAWRSRFSDFLYKADPHAPVRTIVAQLGKYSGPFHWTNRKFTLAEFKRLQSFPDDYSFSGGVNKALQQIGNSVPPLLGYWLALSVQQQVFGCDLGLEMMDSDFQLSYDERKRSKAKKTHTRKIANEASRKTYPLFDLLELTPTETVVPEPQTTSQVIFEYVSQKSRVRHDTVPPQINPLHPMYVAEFQHSGSKCSITMTRLSTEVASPSAILQYRLRFRNPIGDGLSLLEADLVSPHGEDITVVWDMIEVYLAEISGYRTMIDVYGHFTEPHPIFELEMKVLTDNPPFLVRFAEYFSDFSRTARLLDTSVLRRLHDGSNGDATYSADISVVAQRLRQLRWDVRMHETNRTIPAGYFRCCYPFTVSIDKQISVTWTPLKAPDVQSI